MRRDRLEIIFMDRDPRVLFIRGGRGYAFYQYRDRYIEKCQQLEKENDEQKEKLNEMINKEKTSASALQRSTKEHKNLLRQLEIVEIEVQLKLAIYYFIR